MLKSLSLNQKLCLSVGGLALLIVIATGVMLLLHYKYKYDYFTNPTEPVNPNVHPEFNDASKKVVFHLWTQCHHCKALEPVVKNLQKKYPTKVMINYDTKRAVKKSFPHISIGTKLYEGPRTPEALEELVKKA
jgi:thiol-disulfide isomerase/thioredoxin